MDAELEAYQQNELDQFDYDGIILRRADPDDCDHIINLVEVGKDEVYNRVYAYPRILKLIESAYLAITVLVILITLRSSVFITLIVVDSGICIFAIEQNLVLAVRPCSPVEAQ